MPGPQEQRLGAAVRNASPEGLQAAAQTWERCSRGLTDVALGLRTAKLDIPEGEAGALTAAAIGEALARASQKMKDRAEDLAKGRTALLLASSEVKSAQDRYLTLGTEPSAPQFKRPDDPASPEGIAAESAYRADVAAHRQALAEREELCRTTADKLEVRLGEATETMKQIHGIPDPEPTPPGGRPGGGGRGPGSVPSPVRPPGYVPGTEGGGGLNPTIPTPPGEPLPGPGGPGGGPGVPGGPTVPGWPAPGQPPQGTPETNVPAPGAPPIGGGAGPVPSIGGAGSSGSPGANLAAGVGAAGVGAGSGLASMAVGGRGAGVMPVSGAPAAGGGRALGAGGRAGGPGTLGRPTAVPGQAGAGGRSAGAGRAGAGRGLAGAAGQAGRAGTAGSRAGAAGSRGGAAGTRGGAAGGRAMAGAVPGQGGRRGSEEKRSDHEHYDVAEDWIGEDEAEPGVLG